MHHDLHRAAADLEAAAVQHEAGHAGLVGEAEAAHELQRARAAVGERRSAVALEHGGVVVHRDAVVHLPAGAIQEVTRVRELDLHLDDVLLHELVGLDALAELHALVGPGARVLHGGLRLAEQLGQKHAALPLEVLHELVEALALDAQEVGLVDDHVVEVDHREGHDLHADLVERLDGDARRVRRHQVHGHVLVLARRILVLAHHDEAVNVLALGHPGLHAVDVHLAVARAGGQALHALVVRARFGLGDGQAVRRVAVLLVVVHRELDLLRRAEFAHVEHDEQVGSHGDVAAGMVELFDDHGHRLMVDGLSTVFLGQAVHAPTRIDPRLRHFGSDAAVLVAGRDDLLRQVLLGPLADALLDAELFLGVCEIHASSLTFSLYSKHASVFEPLCGMPTLQRCGISASIREHAVKRAPGSARSFAPTAPSKPGSRP